MKDVLATVERLSPEKRKALALLLKKRGIDAYATLPIPRAERDAPLPLSPAQERLWLLAALDADAGAYNIGEAIGLRGALDIAALRASAEALLERHEILRTSFHEVEGNPEQRIHQRVELVLEREQLPVEMSESEALRRVRELAEQEASRPFDLSRAPLIRLRLLQVAPEFHVLLWTLHHIVADGWSISLLIEDFVKLYLAAKEGRAAALPPLTLQYADYAAWQREWLDTERIEAELRHWTERLDADAPALELPFDRPRSSQPSSAGDVVRFALSGELSQGVAELARKHAATPFMVLLAAFEVFLLGVSGQRRFQLGVPVTNRQRPELQTLVGFFVNTLVFRAELEPKEAFSVLLARVKAWTVEAHAHAELPFERLVDALKPARRVGQNPLFEVMFNHQEGSLGALRRLSGLVIQTLERSSRTAQFDLSLDTETDEAGRIHGTFGYRTELFDAATIERFAGHFRRIVRALVACSDVRLAEIDPLGGDERRALLAYSRPRDSVVETSCVLAAIREHVAVRSSAIALVSEHETLSYGELWRRTGQLARRLTVASEARVGVALERSPHAIVAMLAVLRAGAAFVPLDPSYPRERLAVMVEDAEIELVLCDRASRARLVDLGNARLLSVDDLDPEESRAVGDELPTLASAQLAYVIYTSGSTGRPKGVSVSHAAIASHCGAVAREYGYGPGEVVLQFASLNFDGALDQWLAPLTAGATVALRGAEVWSFEQTLDAVESLAVSVVDLLPSYLLGLLRFAQGAGRSLPVRVCIVGGEPLPREALGLLGSVAPAARIINAYGPTEAVVTPLAWSGGEAAQGLGAYAPIGTPLGERSAFVLDAELGLSPLGVVGELYIGGSGLARGYHGRAALTAERFLPDPFAADGGRLYRTGDRARVLPGGTIEYLGRVDEQVKLRGHRIELGEIEAALAAQPGVEEAVVVLREEPKRLVAFVVSAASTQTETELRRALARHLPEYMVPAQIATLARLPRTPAGKLDRRALPELTREEGKTVAAEGEREHTLLSIWRELLGPAVNSVTDNFFELGGDSILSIQVVSRARRAGLVLRPRDVFEHQTIRELARRAERAEGVVPSRRAEGHAPLGPVQRNFFALAVPARHHYNQAVLLEAAAPVDPAALRRAVELVLTHHDAFRLRYSASADGFAQSYADFAGDLDAVLGFEAVRDTGELRKACESAQRSLDLEHGPLLRILALTLADGAQRLLIVVHHLIVDGVSFRLLLEDLFTAYSSLRAGSEPSLLPVTSSFADFTRALTARAVEAASLEELVYWESELGGAPRPAEPVAPARVRDVKTVHVRFERDFTARLLREAPAAYRTQVNELLLTALGRACAKTNGGADVLVELEGHGREDVFEGIDLSRSLGWFTQTYPVRLSGAGDLRSSILATKDRLRRVPSRGIGYGILRELADANTRARLRALPRPSLAFNYLGQFDQSFAGEAPFRPASEGAGADVDPDAARDFALEIDGQVYADQLELAFSYDPGLVGEANAARLAEAFRAELVAVVDHCCAAKGAVSPADFALVRASAADLARIPVPAREIEDVLPLTPMQRGMLFHSVEDFADDPYLNQIRVEVEGLDPARFQEAFQQAVLAHEMLRASFVWQGLEGEPLLVIRRRAVLEVELHDLLGVDDTAARLERLVAGFRRAAADLGQAPLMHLGIIRRDATRHLLIWTAHHLILDGWSASRLLGEVLERYAGAERPRRRVPYRAYLTWLASRDPAAAQAFWRKELESIDEATLLSAAATADGAGTGHAYETVRVPSAELERLLEFVKRERVTLNALVTSAWGLLLARYTRKTRVVFGATVSGRPSELPGADEMLGLFINTLPVVVELESQQSVGDWLRTGQARALAAREYEHTPLYEIQRWLGVEGRALFDSLLVFENYPIDEALKRDLGGLRFGQASGVEATNFAMTIAVVQGADLSLTFEYDRARFTEEWVRELGRRFVGLLRTITETRSVGALGAGTAEDLARVHALLATPPSGVAAAEPDLVTELARIAQARCDAIAVVAGCERTSFGELSRQARCVAARLAALGATREVRVGILCGRRAAFLAAVLGVWQVGAAYVPLDPAYPRSRLELMLGDARVTILIHAGPLPPALELDPAVMLLDITGLDTWQEPVVAPAVVSALPAQLAYVIFTSGSSGRPKGVEVEHGALAEHARAARGLYQFSANDAALHFASMSFDAAVEQWLTPLLAGAKVVLSQGLWSGEETARVVEQERVTVLYPPTSFVTELSRRALTAPLAQRVRVCCVGGEAVTRDVVELIRRGLQPEFLVNGYGPTEAVITPLLWRARENDAFTTAYAPIGRPVAERSVQVLDAHMNPLPVGLVGEVYLGGSVLARGYGGCPGLTAERFVPDPFSARPGARLYRSGDLGRVLADGNVEYLGRADQQVKIRGYRVELGEIEAALAADERVRLAKVVVRAHEGRKQLVAYVESDAGDGLVAELCLRLRASLPEHMVPTTIVVSSRLPRTPNGKLDLTRLPAPLRAARKERPPAGAIEQTLAAIWQGLLGLPAVARDDNFFELGGDSILSIQVVSRARLQGIALKTRDLFEHPTLAALARVARVVEDRAEEAPTTGPFPLTPIQSEFFAREIPARHHFNQALLLEPRQVVDLGALERALGLVLKQHDALRLRFEAGAHGIEQRVADVDADARVLEVHDVRDLAEQQALCQRIQRSLSLAAGPLFRAAYVRRADGAARLLLVIHHLAMDGVSFRILLEDLATAYSAFSLGQLAPDLPPRTSSFALWARRLGEHARSATALAELDYWRETLRGVESTRETQGTTGPRQCETLNLRFGRDLTERLLREAPVAFRTQVGDLLLTALVRALQRWTGHSEHLIALEGHGREADAFDVDLSRTVGWFTSIFPVRLSAQPGLEESLIFTKETLRRVPRRGLGFGILRYLAEPSVRRVLADAPEPAVTFNYLGQFDATFSGEAPFEPARESAGDDADPHGPSASPLVVNGQVYEGELELAFTFDTAVHSGKVFSTLLEAYRDELQALLELCVSGKSGVTPSDFALVALSRAELNSIDEEPSRIEDIYPLTPMQRGMLFHALQAGSDPYLNQLTVSVRNLDARRFIAAFRKSLSAHDALCARFAWEGLSEPVQVILRGVTLPAEEVDLRARTDVAHELLQLKEAERERIALGRAPLMRLLLARVAEEHWEIVWTTHHLVLDGWSGALLLEEVLARYAGAEPEAPRARFRDYLAFIRQRDQAASEGFFRARLAALEEPTYLAALSPTPGGSGHGSLRRSLNRELTRTVVAFCQQARVTVNTLVQAAWSLVLARYSGKATVTFGVTVSGRPAELPDVERTLGLFINTLPVVVTVVPTESVGAWLARIQAEHAAATEHEHTPLYEIQRWAGLRGAALFDSVVVFENYPVGAGLAAQGLGFEIERASSVEHTHYAMTLGAALGAELELAFDYRRDALAAHFVENLGEYFTELLLALVADPARVIGNVIPKCDALLAPDASLQGTVARCVLDSIAEHARSSPEAEALVCGSARLSYGELWARAGSLAATLKSANLQPEARVGVLVERSPGAIVAMLGVMLAGAAFVPLEATQPKPRLARMIRDADLRQVVTSRSLADEFSDALAGLFSVVVEAIEPGSSSVSAPAIVPEQLAYVIYTSGSTGQPKGVAVSHAALAAHVTAFGAACKLGPSDSVLAFASLSFDAALDQWLVPLTCGARVVLRGPELWSPEALFDVLARERVTVADFLPSYVAELARFALEHGKVLPLRRCIVGGEAWPRSLLEQVEQVRGRAELVNGYGPTEAVVTPLIWEATSSELTCAYAPIGLPLPARSTYVLDRDLNLLPDGAVGELFLGGPVLARGYLGRPGATAERFLPDPFASSPGGRLYRTGDWVRRRPGGELEYVGRDDQQVKLRGYRVELGEVEAALSDEPEVKEAVAVVREGPRRLVAFVAPAAGPAASVPGQALRERLARRLPEYLVPAEIIALEVLPRTAVGKIDRRALPELEFARAVVVRAETELERQLVAIWSDVLGVAELGVTDNFFELGGHSILALRLMAEMARAANLRVSLPRLLASPTIRALAAEASLQTGSALLVPLNESQRSEPRLYCFHAALGSVFPYRTLATELAAELSVFGVQVPESLEVDSLAALAELYTQTLLAEPARGPFLLLGWSLGGALAVAVAHRLEARGQRVAFLGLADCFVPRLARAEAPLEAEDQAETAGVLAAARAQLSAPAALDASVGAELGRFSQAFSKLTELSHRTQLETVSVAPACWWSSEVDGVGLELAQGELELALGTRAASVERVSSDHRGLLDEPRFLVGLREALRAHAAPEPEPSRIDS